MCRIPTSAMMVWQRTSQRRIHFPPLYFTLVKKRAQSRP